MTQEDILIIKKKQDLDRKILKNVEKTKDCKKGLELAKKLHMCDAALRYWIDLEKELYRESHYLTGELNNLRESCDHDYQHVGDFNGLFGIEKEYQCTKCGNVIIKTEEGGS